MNTTNQLSLCVHVVVREIFMCVFVYFVCAVGRIVLGKLRRVIQPILRVSRPRSALNSESLTFLFMIINPTSLDENTHVKPTDSSLINVFLYFLKRFPHLRFLTPPSTP